MSVSYLSKNHKSILLLICVLVSSFTSLVSEASGQGTDSGNVKGAASYQWPSSPGRGYAGLYIEDDISHTRRVSTLGTATGTLCTSISDSNCVGKAVGFYAVLPRCVDAASVDCIESVSARSASGSTEQGQFSRYFPDRGLADFAGSPEAKIPSGGSSSLWNIPSATHAGGNEYLAVVSVSGTANAERTALQSPIVHASLYPVKIVAGKFSRNVPLPNGGVSHPSIEPWGNCASLDEGMCAARQEFPVSMAFSMAIRLTSSPNGWLHGRIFDPEISFTKTESFVRIQVEAKPAQVPAVATWTDVALLPKSLTGFCSAEIMCSQVNPQSEGAVSAVEDWRSFYQDKASWTRGQWMFKTLSDAQAGSSSNSCFADKTVLQGFVTTNAIGYSAGPPSFSPSDKSFSYTVSSPHLDEDGNVHVGTYSFVIKTSTARCLYGIADGDISAKLTISTTDGGDITQTSTESVSIDSNWLKVNASGFHYSSPVIKTALWSSVAPSTVVAMPKDSMRAVRILKAGKNSTAKSIAVNAGLVVGSRTKVSLMVMTSSSKYCRVSGTGLRAIKAGTCKVRVSVSTGKKKAISKMVTLKVQK